MHTFLSVHTYTHAGIQKWLLAALHKEISSPSASQALSGWSVALLQSAGQYPDPMVCQPQLEGALLPDLEQSEPGKPPSDHMKGRLAPGTPADVIP